MNCSEVHEILSAYYDGELPDGRLEGVKVHLGGCSECSRRVTAFERLSSLAASVTTPEPPSAIWKQLEQQLDEEESRLEHRALRETSCENALNVQRSTFNCLTTPRLLTLAAILLIAVGLGWWAYRDWGIQEQIRGWVAPYRVATESEARDRLAADFDEYLERFSEDPIKAQRLLAAKYGGQSVEIDGASGHLGYKPAVADGLPDGITLVSTHLMEMPCCTCIGCLCERDDGSRFAVFEHREEQPVWFGDRPAVSASCCGKRCSLMQLDRDLLVGWRQGRRHITVIGARDLEEINRLVAWLDDRKRVEPR